ncbi:hypothetical protein [Tessaracoccus aquimaris]|nr:hypothetical protein [Tessaracoccus aquimaris]
MPAAEQVEDLLVGQVAQVLPDGVDLCGRVPLSEPGSDTAVTS